MIGQVIGNYRIVSELGSGGMGVVYRAEHTQLGRPAAVKMLQPQMSSDASIVQRFFNEARAASSIDHPGIVEIYDFGTHTDGRAYIVMALLKGESLSTRLDRGPIPPLEGATLMVQVASALAAAHARGIVHRDLKPDNIFLVPNEMMPNGIQIKLLDFGIAKLADDQQAGFKTQTGALIGTPAYMSPEQCMGRSDLDHRTDLYSFGCILFHMLCGRPPFLGEHGTGMMIAAHLRDAPPDPRSINPQIPPKLAAVMLRLLEKEPAARLQSAAEVKQALIDAGAHGTLSKPPGDHAPGSYAPTLAVPAQTTNSGSAAQLISAPAKKSNAAVWIGLAVGMVVVGVGVFALTRSEEPAPAPDRVVTGGSPAAPPTDTPAQPTTPSAPAVTPPPPTAPAPPPPTAPAAATPPSATAPAVATPPESAPPDAAVPTTPARTKPTTNPPVAPASTKPDPGYSFRLDATSYAPKAPIEISFVTPISSKPKSKSWITIVEAGKPPSAYTTYEYLPDAARTAKLTAPEKDGSYEVRLHTDYPAKSTNLVAAIPFNVKASAAAGSAASTTATPRAQQRFTLGSTTLKPKQPAKVTFPVALHAAKGERFWITVVTAGDPDDAWGKYEYVPDGAKQMTLAMPSTTPGDYEIRLHANYPTKTTNLVHRAKLRVEAGP